MFCCSLIVTMEKRLRGRPIHSEIRQRIIEILATIGSAYGYKIHKLYNGIFTPCTRENIYYNLKKGVQLGEIAVESVRQEKGSYSWGPVVTKTYYKLGLRARPQGHPAVKEFFDKLKN